MGQLVGKPRRPREAIRGRLAAVLAGLTLASLSCGPQSTADRSGVSLERDGAVVSRGGAGGGSRGNGGATGGGGPTVPPRIANGIGCTVAGACASGHCVDGVCCESACDGVCQRCNLPGSEGRCTPVAKGQDVDDECA